MHCVDRAEIDYALNKTGGVNMGIRPNSSRRKRPRQRIAYVGEDGQLTLYNRCCIA